MAEEVNLRQERARLAVGWWHLSVAVKLGHRHKGAAQEKREEAAHKAKGLLDGAIQDAEAVEKAFMKRVAACPL